MDKNQLEAMNKSVTGLTDSEGDFVDVVKMDVDVYAWFYEQAKQAQILKKKNKVLSDNHFQQLEQNRKIVKQVGELMEQNEKYKNDIGTLRGILEQNKSYREVIKSALSIAKTYALHSAEGSDIEVILSRVLKEGEKHGLDNK